MEKRLVRLLMRILVLSIFIFSMTGTASANSISPVSFDGRHTWTVRPLNRTPNDPLNIQRAVDQAKAGDTIKLAAGVFNFGDFESVSVPKDLTIEGAWDKFHGKPLTTIKGGFAPLALGRLDPGFKPEMMTINGRQVTHITQHPMGKFYFPFMYPPYYNQEDMTWVKEYKMAEHWYPVNVTVRQITFLRPYHIAIFTSAMRGGTIERCQFIGAWPIQSDFWGGGYTSIGVMFWNIQEDLGWAGENFDLPPVVPGSEYIRGNIMLRDNHFESDYGEVLLGAADPGGRVIVTPFDGNSAPPGNDYSNYVVQDVYANPYMFFFHPDETPALYWVRKGYDATLQTIDGQMQIVAIKGQGYGVHMFDTEMTLTVKGNTFHNYDIAVNDASPNGQWGNPLNLIVDSNTITADIHSLFNTWGVTAVLVADWYGGSPGANAVVKNNRIDISFSGPGNTGSMWASSAIDIEVMGQATITGNILKTNLESAISLGAPMQNALVKDNRISGSGSYAFAAFFSGGNQFIDNTIAHFTPTGPGIYDPGGWGWPPAPIPAARGILYASDSNLVQGIGAPGPLDIVYDCGSGNTIINMTVMACPAAPEAITALSARSAQAQAGMPMGKRMQYRDK